MNNTKKLTIKQVREIAQVVMDNHFSRSDYHATHLKNIKTAIVNGILDALETLEDNDGKT